jgi:hypothetical protein
LQRYCNPSWNRLVVAVHRILGSERDPEVLVGDLDPESSMIVETILAALSDPSALSDLLPPEAPKAQP